VVAFHFQPWITPPVVFGRCWCSHGCYSHTSQRMVLIEAFHSSRDITLVEPFDWKPIQGHFILAFH